MKRILVLVPGYLPGFKSGGPVRTISNMVDALGDELDFYVVCLDHDLGENKPYGSIDRERWNRQGKAKVFYIERGPRGVIKLFGILRSFDFDLIHINSFFSFQFGILPFLFNKIVGSNISVILGPRGEFSQGALALKSFKKKVFIRFARAIGLYRGVVWHASSTFEAEDIRRVMGRGVSIRLAIDIAKSSDVVLPPPRSLGQEFRIVFVSRIAPMKNLKGVFEILSSVRGLIGFDVYGPIEDREYWNKCLVFAEKLPSNIKFKYCGELKAHEVTPTVSNYDLFLFPTLGENFGHVIAEALFAGVPVLISDATPWRNLLKKGIGWDLPLECQDQFVECIESCCKISSNEYAAWRSMIKTWAIQNIGNQEAVEENRKLFMVD